MAIPIGRTARVGERLVHQPYRFDFFQAVRLLEQGLGVPHFQAPQGTPEPGEQDAAHFHRHPVGYDAALDDEIVRFRTTVSRAFPATEIVSLRPTRRASLPEMVVSFMGIVGPSGVMPDHYTEMLRELELIGETANHEFLDLFLHRALSLFYRAWKKNERSASYEQHFVLQLGHGPQAARPADMFSDCMCNLTGLGLEAVRDNLAANFASPAGRPRTTADRQRPDPFGLRITPQSVRDAVLYYAGHFASSHRSAARLEDLLGDVFAENVQVEPFQGSWLFLEPEDGSRLPSKHSSEQGNWLTHLGDDFILGTQVWDQETKFLIKIGPLTSPDRFYSLLPWQDLGQDSGQGHDRFRPNEHFRLLQQLTHLYAGKHYAVDVNLLLHTRDLPAFRLPPSPRRGPNGNATGISDLPGQAMPLLGWTTVLGGQERGGVAPHGPADSAPRSGPVAEGVFCDIMFSLDFISTHLNR